METQAKDKPEIAVPIELKLALSVEEAAALGGWRRSHTYHLIKTGRLKARKSGTRTLILRADLNAYIESLPIMKSQGAA